MTDMTLYLLAHLQIIMLTCRLAPAARVSPPSGGAAGGGWERERGVRDQTTWHSHMSRRKP